jgi:hypothetical protein
MSRLRRASDPSTVVREDSSGSDIVVLAATDDEEEDEGMVQCSKFVRQAGPYPKTPPFAFLLLTTCECSVLKLQGSIS